MKRRLDVVGEEWTKAIHCEVGLVNGHQGYVAEVSTALRESPNTEVP